MRLSPAPLAAGLVLAAAVSLSGGLISPVDLRAQETPPPAVATPEIPGAGNFAFAPAEGRHLKIDRRSGAVSVCEETDGRWSCRLVPDDRQAYEDEIARLQKEKAEMADRLAAIETRLAQLEEGREWIGPEGEKKLDEFMDFTDKAFRRFFGMVEDLKRDFEEPDRI